MKTFKQNKLATVAGMLGVAFFAAAAHADGNSLAVRYADLNLNTAAGAKVLYQRIHNAAEQVCGEVDARDLIRSSAVKDCQDQAIENSVRAVGNTQLTRLANEHGYGLSAGVTVAAAR